MLLPRAGTVDDEPTPPSLNRFGNGVAAREKSFKSLLFFDGLSIVIQIAKIVFVDSIEICSAAISVLKRLSGICEHRALYLTEIGG